MSTDNIAVEAPLDMSPDSGINELQGLTPEEQERQRKEWQDELVKLQTFEVEAPHETAEEVSDGVAMAQALTQIAPEWFDEVWMSKIKRDTGNTGNNWRIKLSNLKKIVEGIVDYKIGEKCDSAELGRLFQIIFGCAINCNHKQVIMQSIQELESNTQVSLEVETEAQRLAMEPEIATEARVQMTQRCHELYMQVTLLQEEKASLQQENNRLQERIKEFETLEGPLPGSGHRYKELRKQVDFLKEELFKTETSRDGYRLKLEILEKENLEMQLKIQDLQRENTGTPDTPEIKLPCRKRGPDYTFDEELKILEYIKKNNLHSQVGRTATWKQMESDSILEERPWTSLKNHFVKFIKPNITMYPILSKSDVERLNKTDKENVNTKRQPPKR